MLNVHFCTNKDWDECSTLDFLLISSCNGLNALLNPPPLSEPLDCSDIWPRVSSCSSCSYSRHHSHSDNWSSAPQCGRACASPGSPWTWTPFHTLCTGTPSLQAHCPKEAEPLQRIPFHWIQEQIRQLFWQVAKLEEEGVWRDQGSSPPWERKC